MKPIVVKQNRDEKLENIDTNSVKTAYNILLAFIVIEILFVVFWAIYLWVTATKTVPSTVTNKYGVVTATAQEETNIFQVVMGFVVLFFGTLIAILEWFLLKPVIGMIYDIKLIRYHLDSKGEIRDEMIKK